ncbi:MAG: phosphate ABC transporter substrate-binding protein [Desulfobacterales bacterium]|nr:phosphate ABC transporter substrate-binding protein [Desulfobacterales bacterium]MCP4162177.1 phosphate ABC transporter substrate-binding protein [Deltaproteobacteria bacterium]
MKVKKYIALLIATSLLIPGMSLAERLVLKGSTTVLPIAQKVSEAYMKMNPDVKISLSGGGSSNGIKAIIDGTTDIGNASRFIKGKEVKLAVTKGVYPVPHRIALDCIVPVVHKSNGVSNLTVKQLRNIYLGKIRNWSEVGGANKRIVVISRDSSSGTYDAWKSLVMKKKRVVPSALTVPSNGGLVQAISNTKGAVGYIALGYVTKTIKTLKVEGIRGSEKTTKQGVYPISRPLYMFTKSWPKGKTLDFINYILSVKGQKLVKSVGSIPLY